MGMYPIGLVRTATTCSLQYVGIAGKLPVSGPSRMQGTIHSEAGRWYNMTNKIKYLQTNGKLENSSVYTYAFNLPAIETCPGAGICKEYCFAASEQKRYPAAYTHRQHSQSLSRTEEFVETIGMELGMLRRLHAKRGTAFAVRIHASGDFYSNRYAMRWLLIADQNPDVQFYAYTKSVSIWRLLKRFRTLPKNLCIIYSLGGLEDNRIDLANDRHARIFQSEQDALDAGYALASEDDSVAWDQSNNKIGLVIFGATNKWKKTQREAATDEQPSGM